ncbi:MAG: hypothetical protein R6W96_08345 [Clostridia bacterium]
MDIKKKDRRPVHKERNAGLLLFLLEFAVIVFFFVSEARKWLDRYPADATEFIVWNAVLVAVLLSTGLAACIFSRGITTEKKVLVVVGSVSLALGVLGFTPYVIGGTITFPDAVYKSIQLFVGEFDEGVFGGGRVPPLVDVARYLALFVTFGTIAIILLRQRIQELRLRLFYRDVVIITDRPDAYVADLARNFAKDRRRVVVGYIAETAVPDHINSGDIPVIPVNMGKDMEAGLRACNVKNARSICLLCEDTRDNVLLLKAIDGMLVPRKKHRGREHSEESVPDAMEPSSVEEMVSEICRLLSAGRPPEGNPGTGERSSEKVCYVSYRTDEEKEYYSLDDVFTHRREDLEIYFINILDISVRQMIASSGIVGTLGIRVDTTPGMLVKSLEEITIAVAGSGKILSRTLVEIARNCVYSAKSPMTVFHVKTRRNDTDLDSTSLPPFLKDILRIENISAGGLARRDVPVSLFFISSDDDKEIHGVIKDIFQHDLHHHVREYLVLANGGIAEHEILKTYLEGLVRPYLSGAMRFLEPDFCPVIRLGRTKGLILSIDRFYGTYGPAIKDVHHAYGKAMAGNALSDFNSLPEIFIESSLLSSLHNQFFIDVTGAMLRSRETTCKGEGAMHKDMLECLEYLARTEHERWYNERTLRGTIYSADHNHVHHKNAKLLHWGLLDKARQEDNLRYVVRSLLEQVKKGRGKEAGLPGQGTITEYHFRE